MRIFFRMLAGAGLGVVVATALLVVSIFITEWGRAEYGWSYNDMTAAYIAYALLVAAPIVGAWWGWVRR